MKLISEDAVDDFLKIFVVQGSGDVCYHDAVFINDNGVGVITTAAYGFVVVTGSIIHKENHFGSGVVILDIAGRGIAEAVGMDGHHNDGVSIIFRARLYQG